MDVMAEEIPFKQELYAVVGCAMEVLNELGHGFPEKRYENALVVEFSLKGIPYRQQPRFEMLYKGVPIGDFIPDLICYDAVVVDTKVIEKIGDAEVGQMLNYLKVTGLSVGAIINFSKPQLDWPRIVLERNRR